ncbi:hypothetical protein Tco_0592579 [Tanacetum coccineum]
MRDVEWEPIEEERLEEPKEGWMLGESKKRSIRISSQMLIVGLVPRIGRMRELVVRYKAEKVCHEEMVKMPLVDLKVLEVYTKSKEEHESHLKMSLELLKKREVLCEAQQGQSGVKRKLFGSCRNNIGNESILALPEGSDNFVVMHRARVMMLA